MMHIIVNIALPFMVAVVTIQESVVSVDVAAVEKIPLRRRKLYQTQECILVLREDLFVGETEVEVRRGRHLRPIIEFTEEQTAGPLEGDSGSSAHNLDDDYYVEDGDDFEFNSTAIVAGPTHWACELSDVDAAASGQQFVDVHGLDEEFFVSQGVVSGETTFVATDATIEGCFLEIRNPANVRVARRADPTSPESGNESMNSDRRRLSGSSTTRLPAKHTPRTSRNLSSSSIGTRTVLVIRTLAMDSTVSHNEDKLTDDVFDDSNCLRTQYLRCSHNKLNFVKATGKDINNGVLSLSVNINVRGRDKEAVQSEVVAAANEHFGQPMQNMFDHVILCLPPGTISDWIAYAYVNSWLSIYNDEWCGSVSAQMHEVGHNLGLAHSGELESYDDNSGMMGASYVGDDTPKMCFNPVKSWQLGWYQDQTKEHNPLNEGWLRASLVGVESYGQDQSKFVVIKISDIAKNQDFYIGYNHASGGNSETQEGANQLWVGLRPLGSAYEPSKLLQKLDPTQTYEIENFRNSRKTVVVRFSQQVNPGEVLVDIWIKGSNDSPPTVSACGGGQTHFEIDLNTDNYGGETSWTVTDRSNNNTVVASGSNYFSDSPYRLYECLDNGKGYTFTINDSYGDGICCLQGQGSYKLFLMGNEIISGGNFAREETHDFNT